MYRTAIRAVPRTVPRAISRHPVRFASSATSTAKKSTWRGAALRWGAAIGALYWYNTSPLFQDDPNSTKTVPPPPQFSDDDAPTVEAVIVQKRKQAEAKALARQKSSEEEPKSRSANPSSNLTAGDGSALPEGEEGMADIEAEADQQAAFNPETGEINWDCPCLGGMAHGPCGEEFKAAFSCFVYSEEEPKGIGCIDKFQSMQECFKKYPEIYGEELADDDENEAPPSRSGEDEEGETARQLVKEKIDAPEGSLVSEDDVRAKKEELPPVAKKDEATTKKAEPPKPAAQKKEDVPTQPHERKNPMRDAS